MSGPRGPRRTARREDPTTPPLLEPGSELALALTPHGAFHLEHAPGSGVTVSGAIARRIEAAFAEGASAGLFHLAARELSTPLSPSLAFGRELARRYLTALCSAGDATAAEGRAAPPVPDAELDELASAAPPIRGGEYLDRAGLSRAWRELDDFVWTAIARHGGSSRSFLAERAPLWNLVGRVHFHLAENKANPSAPFAFLATYTTKLSTASKVQHRPLGKALEELAGARNRKGLLALLEPVHRASEKSAFLKELVDGGGIFRPLAWSPAEAYRFLEHVPAFEEAGVVVRVPGWWKARHPPRLQVQVRVGSQPPSTLGVGALLDFEVAVTLGGDPISDAEWRELGSATEGLALVRGQWVELDRARLDAALAHWKTVQRHAGGDGLAFVEGMRMLAGAAGPASDEGTAVRDARSWSEVVAGPWLAEVLSGLGEPAALPDPDPGDDFGATLRPYQRLGLRWLWLLAELGLGACLADDMGLGKTVQVLALLAARQRAAKGAGRAPSLLVAPASLLPNWQAEMERFAPGLRFLVAHPSARPTAELVALAPDSFTGVDVVMTTYGFVPRLPWAAAREWDLVVLDEAQAIKNAGTRQARAVKTLTGRARIALTGTPIENHLGDLWSLFDFLCPGLLGSAKAFAGFAKRLASEGGRGYAPLRKLVRPYILRRLKTDPRVIDDLPEKVEMKAFCGLTKLQAVLYQQSVDELARRLEDVDEVARRGVVLAFLTRLKQICNHPSQWLKDGAWAPDASGKLARLGELASEIAERQEKMLVFTQFREMTEPLAGFLATVFGRSGVVLHGEIAVRARKERVEAFQREDGPPFFVLSLKAGGTGLNLTAASHVVHFDRWWNPAVENQATDRAFRIGQRKNVMVHKLVCSGTIEERIDALIASKQGLSEEILAGTSEVAITELSNDELLRLVALDLDAALAET